MRSATGELNCGYFHGSEPFVSAPLLWSEYPEMRHCSWQNKPRQASSLGRYSRIHGQQNLADSTFSSMDVTSFPNLFVRDINCRGLRLSDPWLILSQGLKSLEGMKETKRSYGQSWQNWSYSMLWVQCNDVTVPRH